MFTCSASANGKSTPTRHGTVSTRSSTRHRVDTYSTRHRVELRRLTLGGRCGRRYPVTSSVPFDLDECSSLIAVVVSDTYSKNPVYQPLEGLLAVPGAAGAVDIYLQVSIRF